MNAIQTVLLAMLLPSKFYFVRFWAISMQNSKCKIFTGKAKKWQAFSKVRTFWWEFNHGCYTTTCRSTWSAIVSYPANCSPQTLVRKTAPRIFRLLPKFANFSMEARKKEICHASYWWKPRTKTEIQSCSADITQLDGRRKTLATKLASCSILLPI